MPSLKQTQINASFFPGVDGAEDSRVEDVATKAVRTGVRGLGDDENPASFPSTRRSSMTAVEKGHPVEHTGKTSSTGKIQVLHFEEGDPENPLNYSKKRKWTLTFLLCMMTLLVGLSTSAYSTTVNGMAAEFGVAPVVAQVGMFTFNFSCALTPLVLAPLCELIGRREVYLMGYGLFVVVFLMLALAKNIETAIIGRFFSGLFGSIGTILVGGSMADIWNTRDRGLPMSCFTFVAIFSTIAAPAYCGYIVQYTNTWRWVEWVHMIAAGVLFVFEVLFLKETRGAKILTRRAKQMRKETGNQNIRAPAELESESVKDLLKKSSTRALMLLVKEPVILFFGFWIAMAWGITFAFLSVIPLTFEGNHGWSTGNGGLPYLALILGCFIGFGTGMWADRKYFAVQKANDGIAVPEYRLYGSMVFSWLLPAGLLVFSFTQYAFVHWMGPMVGLVMIITGIYHIFLATYNYTSDAYGEFSSSAIAGQSLLRNGFAAAFPLFSSQMFRNMGYQWAGLLLACITLVISPLPYILFHYGARIRNASPYAQTEDEIQAVGAAAQRDPAAAEDDDVTVAESMASVTVRPAITKEATQTAGLV